MGQQRSPPDPGAAAAQRTDSALFAARVALVLEGHLSNVRRDGVATLVVDGNAAVQWRAEALSGGAAHVAIEASAT